MILCSDFFLSGVCASSFCYIFFSQSYVIYVGINRIKIVQSLEGRFEESVIAYLFLVNILPILIVPMIWTETGKFTKVLNDWTDFEVSSTKGSFCVFFFSLTIFSCALVHSDIFIELE